MPRLRLPRFSVSKRLSFRSGIKQVSSCLSIVRKMLVVRTNTMSGKQALERGEAR